MKSTISLLTVTGLIIGLLLTQIGCTESGQEPTVTSADNPALATPVPEGMVRGTVLETMNAGGYTYVFIETDEDKRWVAGPKAAVSVGDIIQTGTGMPMHGFTSKKLNRTFDVLYFVDALQNLSMTAVPADHPDVELPPGHPSTEMAGDTTSADTQVAEFKPGQDIAYLYANKDTLAGQKISLRGKVVKYNAGILGWNFIHIRDGSGDVADGSNDLTVTSKATTALGETVVVTGTIILDKDFGAGYSFPLLMEDASITPE